MRLVYRHYLLILLFIVYGMGPALGQSPTPSPAALAPPIAIQLTENTSLLAGQQTSLHATGQQVPSALAFDGVDDVVRIADPADPSQEAYFSDVTNTFTVEAWVWPTAPHEIDPQHHSGITGTSGQRYLIFPTFGGRWGDYGKDAGMGISVGTNGVSVYEHNNGYMPAVLVWEGTLTGWTHIAVVYTDRLPSLYINGRLVAISLFNGVEAVHPSLGFGGGPYGYFQGGVAGIRLWNTARTPAQIQQSHLLQDCSQEAALVGDWRLGEGAGTLVHDASARQQTGTFAPASDASAPGPTWLHAATGPITWQWSPAAGLATTSGAEVTAQPTRTTLYTVTASTGQANTVTRSTVAVTVEAAYPACPALPVTISAPQTSASGEAVSLHATASWVGAALSFDGQADRLWLPSPQQAPTTSLSATLTNTFTVEGWVKPALPHEIDAQSSSSTTGTEGQHYLLFPEFGAGLNLGSDHAGMGISVGTNGVSVYEHNGYYMPPVLVWEGSLTTWTHVAVVYENKIPRLYINGVFVQQGIGGERPYVHPSYQVGGGGYGAYEGSLHELRIWRTARTAAQIGAAYQQTMVGDEVGLAGCWHLDEATGHVAHDATAGQRHGQLPLARWEPTGTAPALQPVLRWSPAADLNAATGETVVATPTTTTTYTVTALGSGCTYGTASTTITIGPPPPLTNPPTTPCAPTLAGTAPDKVTTAPAVNYVRTFAARTALTDPAALTLAADKRDVQVKTEYLDGLGRPIQTVLHQQSPEGLDVVQPVAYDALGRQPRQYLPYAAPNASQPAGSYHPDALREQFQFYHDSPVGPGYANDDVARTGVAYSEQVFEASPLSRVLEQAAPGEAWALGQGHTVGRQERPNTTADAVPRYQAAYGSTAAAAHVLSYQGSYPAGELWVTQTTDEQGTQDGKGFRTLEFKDKQGQVVLKQVEQAAGQWLSTSYVYDDFSRLRAVLPPKATKLLAASQQQVTAAVDSLLFTYRYDGRGRVLAKQVPGQAGEVQLVYDQLDRPILTQDPQQRTRQEWSWSKYDALGRVILTGLVTRAASAEQLQQEADQRGTAPEGQTPTLAQYEQPAPSGPHYYSTTGSYPRLNQDGFSAAQILTVSYYDGYDFDQNGQPDTQFDSQYASQFPAGAAPQADGRVTGLPTRTQTRVLGVAEGQPGAWLVATTFYDEKARPVQVVSTNARGGQDVVTTQLDFTGQVMRSYSVHTGPSNTTLPLTETFAYDHAGRLLEARQQLPGEAAPVVIAAHHYNALGQLVQKTLAPGSALTQQLDYTYNIRGWLTGLNQDFVTGAPSDGNDLWGMQLSYACGFLVPQYNGNIAGQQWRSQSDGVARAYGYLYDGANRLTAGDYVAQTPTGQWAAEQQHYGLAGMRYDENGNLLALQRRGLLRAATHALPAGYGATDNLRYKYQGNRLVGVEDAVSGNALPQPAGAAAALTSLAGDFQEKSHYQVGGPAEYGYDANGNLTSDQNKGITGIRYNHLNLPEQVNFSAQDYIEFRYAASGQKVAKRVHQSGKPVVQTDYLGAYQYEGDSLRFFPHAEGRVLRAVSFTSGQVRYEREFSLKDHLGNLRVAYRKGTRASYWASMEPSRARTEEAQWDSVSIASTRFAAGPQAHTSTAEGGYVARLNAAAGHPIGPLKLLQVHKGDTLDVLAPGYYPQPLSSGSSFSFSLLSFVTQLLSQQPAAPTPTADGPRKLKPLPFLGIGLAIIPSLQQTGRIPKGYLRVLVFNKDSVLLSEQTITKQLTEAAGSGYEELRTHLVAQQDGYVQVYVGNESEVDVLFDDVQVDYRPGLLVQENHYDPWGLNLAGLEKTGGTPLNQYQFNGKEKQAELGLGWTDYGLRRYDAQLGRWQALDAMSELYFNWTPYSYALNTPTNALDPDGNLVIFINGQNSDQQGGKPVYWQQPSQLKFFGDINSRPSLNSANDWRRVNEPLAFDEKVMDHFNDHNSLYFDGALGGWSGGTLIYRGISETNLNIQNRYTSGYHQGSTSAAEIIRSLKRSGGVITESVKIVAHSMGGAYAKGFIQALVEYAETHPEEAEGLSIAEYDFASYQQDKQKAVRGVSLFQYDNENDPVVGGWSGALNGSKHEKQGGAEEYRSNVNPNGGHSIFDFVNAIKNLPAGTYKFENGNFVRTP